MDEHSFDVVVIGGGLIGLCAAAAMDALGYRTLLVERREQRSLGQDRRVLALSEGSRLILQRLRIWPLISEVTAITEIIVSDQTHPTQVLLRAAECEVDALGQVTRFNHLTSAVQQHVLGLDNVQVRYGCEAHLLDTAGSSARLMLNGSSAAQVVASLVVHAEGASGSIDAHSKDYGQWAIVSEVQWGEAVAGRAYEHFTENGPVALLPLGERYALIWTVPAVHRQEFLDLETAEFSVRLERCLGLKPNTLREVGMRAGFPLSMRKSRRTVEGRGVRIGNAAQQLHPVAAQGFNLGLRDVWELHECLWDSPTDPGSGERLQHYGNQRRHDRDASVFITDSMVSIFGSRHPLARASRGAALAAFAKFKSLREILAHRMMFGSR